MNSLQTVFNRTVATSLANLFVSPPSIGGQRWRLRTISLTVVTDANVADRTFAIRTANGAGDQLCLMTDGAIQLTNLTVTHSWQTGGDLRGVVDATNHSHVIPETICEAGWTVSVATLNAQAGDTIGPAIAVWELL